MTTKTIRKQLEEWEQKERVELARKLEKDQVAYYRPLDWDVHFLSQKLNLVAELFEQRIAELEENATTLSTKGYAAFARLEEKVDEIVNGKLIVYLPKNDGKNIYSEEDD